MTSYKTNMNSFVNITIISTALGVKVNPSLHIYAFHGYWLHLFVTKVQDSCDMWLLEVEYYCLRFVFFAFKFTPAHAKAACV